MLHFLNCASTPLVSVYWLPSGLERNYQTFLCVNWAKDITRSMYQRLDMMSLTSFAFCDGNLAMTTWLLECQPILVKNIRTVRHKKTLALDIPFSIDLSPTNFRLLALQDNTKMVKLSRKPVSCHLFLSVTHENIRKPPVLCHLFLSKPHENLISPYWASVYWNNLLLEVISVSSDNIDLVTKVVREIWKFWKV